MQLFYYRKVEAGAIDFTSQEMLFNSDSDRMCKPFAIRKPKLMTSVQTLCALTAHWTFEGPKRFDGDSTAVKVENTFLVLKGAGRACLSEFTDCFDRWLGNKMTMMDATILLKKSINNKKNPKKQKRIH